MAYIEKDEALAIIENKQREICQMGRYSRNAVYGSDREAFDNWQEILDEIEAIPSADVAPVRHAYWVPEEHADQVSPTTIHRYTWYYCSECGRRLIGYKNPVDAPYCHCGCKMDLEG